MLRSDKVGERDLVTRGRQGPHPDDHVRGGYRDERARYPKARKGKRRKSMFKKIFEEAFDVIEDILD